ncbi:septum formation family protein [Microbacterium oleivorans]|uniref:septum formation family protein n=1 Tax=Microbacterium oleivorans TaxID=273677 RepID=UPI0007676347|nr:septum formation family protein [Microbacterium oleivorans]
MSAAHSRRCAVLAAVVVAASMTPLLSGCTQVVAVVAGTILEVRGGPSRPQPSPGAEAEADDVDNDIAFEYLRIGDCFDDPNEYDGGEGEGEGAWTMLLIPCEEPHWYELYAKGDLGRSHFPEAMSPTAEFPGDEAVSDAAEEICYDAFADYVGGSYEDSTLEYWYYLPTAESWAHGDRMARCVIGLEEGTIAGSAAGSGRSVS